MTHLTSLPAEVLSAVTRLLQLHEVTRLVKICGSLALRHKCMSQAGITELNVTTAEALSLMFLPRQFPLFSHLTHLEIGLSQRPDLLIVPPMPLWTTNLPATLLSIKFFFVNSVESWFRPIDLATDDVETIQLRNRSGYTCEELDRRFPQLHTLHLLGRNVTQEPWSTALQSHFVRHFPSSLTSLRLQEKYWSYLHNNLLLNLPSFTRDLRGEDTFTGLLGRSYLPARRYPLRHAIAWDQLDVSTLEAILPPFAMLQRLKLKNTRAESSLLLLGHLTSLQDLTLILNYSHDLNAQSLPLILPPRLTRLKLTAKKAIIDFPSFFQSLSQRTSLRSLHVRKCYEYQYGRPPPPSEAPLIVDLPPKLESFSFFPRWGDGGPHPVALNTLPTSLTQFRLGERRGIKLAHLSNLQRLIIDEPSDLKGALPQNLRELQIVDYATFEQLRRLPKGIPIVRCNAQLHAHDGYDNIFPATKPCLRYSLKAIEDAANSYLKSVMQCDTLIFDNLDVAPDFLQAVQSRFASGALQELEEYGMRPLSDYTLPFPSSLVRIRSDAHVISPEAIIWPRSLTELTLRNTAWRIRSNTTIETLPSFNFPPLPTALTILHAKSFDIVPSKTGDAVIFPLLPSGLTHLQGSISAPECGDAALAGVFHSALLSLPKSITHLETPLALSKEKMAQSEYNPFMLELPLFEDWLPALRILRLSNSSSNHKTCVDLRLFISRLSSFSAISGTFVVHPDLWHGKNIIEQPLKWHENDFRDACLQLLPARLRQSPDMTFHMIFSETLCGLFNKDMKHFSTPALWTGMQSESAPLDIALLTLTHLPSRLTSLDMSSIFWMDEYLGLLPPGLTDLSLRFGVFDRKQLLTLPASLRFLSLSVPLIDGLGTGYPMPAGRILTPELISSLPTALESLSVTGLTVPVASLALLPASLTILSMNIESVVPFGQVVSQLPKALKHLTASWLTAYALCPRSVIASNLPSLQFLYGQNQVLYAVDG